MIYTAQFLQNSVCMVKKYSNKLHNERYFYKYISNKNNLSYTNEVHLRWKSLILAWLILLFDIVFIKEYKTLPEHNILCLMAFKLVIQ